MKRLIMLAALVVAALSFATVAAAANYELFGDATLVTGNASATGWQENTATGPNFFGGASFTSSLPATVNDLATLSTDYKFTAGDCGLGSPRFSVTVDQAGTPEHLFFYLGTGPTYTSCSTNWTNTGNLADGANLVDASQLGGSFYDSFSDVKTAFGGLAITRISLVMDGPSQTSQFDNTLVNATTYTYEPPPCTETGLMRDGINLTAKIVNPTTSVTGAVNATGCNIGVYFGDGHSGTVSGANISGANYYGVVADGAAVDITADIHDIGENPLNGSQHGVAVLYTTVHQSGSTTLNAATGTLSGSTITHYQKNGVVVSGAGASVNVLNNTVTGQGHINSIAQNGIQISAGASALVKGNTVSGNWYTPATVTACGLLFFQAGGVKQQMNNLFDNQTNLCNAGRGGGGTSAG